MTNEPRDAAPSESLSHCDDTVRLVWPLLDDELTPREASRVRVHLGECASCRGVVRFERAFLHAMRAALRDRLGRPPS